MKRNILTAVLVLLLAGGLVGFLVWRFGRTPDSDRELELYGNVDLRQVELSFNNSERITSVLAQEGDHVLAGQIVARLDEGRLIPQVAQIRAIRDAQAAVVERFHNGSRPEEIAQARANADAATADAKNARVQLDRLKSLSESSVGRAVSRQDLDNATAAVDMANARLDVNKKAWDLLVAGPRKEDIAQAEAQLAADEAQLKFVQQQLRDASLIAPMDAVVRTRLMEPGEMASPQKPVFTLAIINPKWVRVYVAEPDLGKVHQGMNAHVTADSFPGKRFDGWVGFISPVAEFTPKPVQTEELRTKLVYEVRVFVKDPGDELRLGMPATAHLELNGGAPASRPESTTEPERNPA
jgi:HlyD family secretion protein